MQAPFAVLFGYGEWRSCGRPDQATYLYINRAAAFTQHMRNQSRVCLLLCAACCAIACRILHPARRSAPAIRRAGLRNLCLRRPAPGEGGNKVFGKRFARLLPVRPRRSSSSPLACCAPSSTPETASCRATGLSVTSVRVRHVAHI